MSDHRFLRLILPFPLQMSAKELVLGVGMTMPNCLGIESKTLCYEYAPIFNSDLSLRNFQKRRNYDKPGTVGTRSDSDGMSRVQVPLRSNLEVYL